MLISLFGRFTAQFKLKASEDVLNEASWEVVQRALKWMQNFKSRYKLTRDL